MHFDAPFINNLLRLQEIIRTMAFEGAKWKIKAISNRLLSPKLLTLDGVIWTTLIKINSRLQHMIMPSILARVALCHCIMKRILIDVGAIISDSLV